MRRIALVLILCICTLISVVADDFKILYVTTPSISINGKNLKAGDIFPGGATINWTSPRQAMKVLDLSTNKQTLVVAEKYKEVKSKNMASYLVAAKQLSTRRGAIINTMELGIVLGDTHYLLDPIKIETLLPIDADRFFFASYEYNGEIINKLLPSEDNSILFDKSLYVIDGKEIEPFDLNLSVWYMDRIEGNKTIITDKMVLLPVGK